MLFRRLFAPVLAACIVGTVGGEATDSNADSPKSLPALTALERYSTAVGKAREDYGRSMIAAEKELDAHLAIAFKAAMSTNNLDEANRISAARTACEGRLKSAKEMATEPHTGSFMVLAARYGLPGKSIDITQQVSRLVKGNQLEVPSRLDLLFGQDPAPGQLKMIAVKVDLGASIVDISWNDFQDNTVTISPAVK